MTVVIAIYGRLWESRTRDRSSNREEHGRSWAQGADNARVYYHRAA